MIHKRKRDIGERLHPRYAAVLSRLAGSPAFASVSPDASALEIIARSDAVVSMPFTSTALLGRHLGKPSIFYDPHGLIQKDDRAAHGIPIVTGRAELIGWLAAELPGAVGSRAAAERMTGTDAK
jgi:polysaccharide biosynthesis PFTS motif protein